MDLIEGLSKALRKDAQELRESLQTERQWCFDAFVTVRPILVAAVEDTQQALLDEPVASSRLRHREAQFQDAVNALWFCDDRIKGLRKGMADLAARETKET